MGVCDCSLLFCVSIRAGQIRNKDSARVSMPGQLEKSALACNLSCSAVMLCYKL